MKVKPLYDRILVKRLEEKEQKRGGIIIPDTAKEKPMEGEVVACGPGARGEDGTLHRLDVKAGDRVLYGKWSGTEVKIDGETLLVMKESDVLGIIEGGRYRRFLAKDDGYAHKMVFNVFEDSRRNLWLGHGRTLSRKAQEVVLAWTLEHLTAVPKRRLLEIYLNIIEWGPDVQGAAEAARYYFDQDPSRITTEEALFLTTG